MTSVSFLCIARGIGMVLFLLVNRWAKPPVIRAIRAHQTGPPPFLRGRVPRAEPVRYPHHTFGTGLLPTVGRCGPADQRYARLLLCLPLGAGPTTRAPNPPKTHHAPSN